jgi:hypothetical protein
VLTNRLRSTFYSHTPPAGLIGAVEQWRRGRCVVLACPQCDEPASAAWAVVLWPRRAISAQDIPFPLMLFGLRVEARLVRAVRPQCATSYHVRVVKQQHRQFGCQLFTLADRESQGRVAANRGEAPLSAVLRPSPRARELCLLNGDGVRRFWAALGAQQSVHVIVSARPLLPPLSSPSGARSC